MLNNGEISAILEKLIPSTKQKRITWHPIDTNSYQCSFPRSSIVLTKEPSINFYNISILNESGDEVGKLFEMIGVSADAINLKMLFDLAEAQALNIDDTLNDILSNLDDIS